MSDTDPTLQSVGWLVVTAKNDLGYGYLDSSGAHGLDIPRTALQYAPADAPPPAWSGNQWQSGDTTAYPFGTFLPGNPLMGGRVAGLAQVAQVSDMSSNAVMLDKQYIFTSGNLDSGWPNPGLGIELLWTVTGVLGGSTLLPGFGFFNLIKAPNVWTYISPSSFDGWWGVELRHSWFEAYVQLSVEYVPAGQLMVATPTPLVARLNYTIAGGWVTNGVGVPEPAAAVDRGEPVLELFGDDYVVRDDVEPAPAPG